MSPPRKPTGFVTMWILATLSVASLWLFRGPLTWNETSRFPVAKHFLDSTWIPSDWWINSPVLYQIPFNLLAAPFIACFDLGTAAILIRLVLYAWFSSGVVALARRLEISLIPVIPAIMVAVAYRTRSLAAHEFMVEGAEMKTVAYGAVLWAISMLLGKRYRLAAAFLGLAATFHVLVGFYAALTGCLFLLTHPRHRHGMMKSLPVSIPVYLVCGGYGVFVGLHTLMSSGDSDAFTNLIYIARNRHHIWPPAWWGNVVLNLPFPIDRLVWVAKALMSLVILVLVSVRCRSQPFRDFAHLALLSSWSFVVGLLIYSAGPIGLLKYYPFRFPDVLVPFASFLLFFGVWERMASDSNSYCQSPRIRKFLGIGLRVVTALLVVAGSLKTVSHLQVKWRANVPWQYVLLSPEDREATQWIRDNTPADAVFLADPYFEAFYVTAERGAMVLYKHIPSDLEGMKEWHDRLVAVNGGREVLIESLTIDRDQIQHSFSEMPLEYARDLARQYDLDHYYGPYRGDWEIAPLFKAGNKAIYRFP